MTTIEIGRLLRAGISGCVVGCRVSRLDAPAFGGLVRIPLDEHEHTQVYGLIYDIHIDDDGLVRQLVSADNVSEDVIQDKRVNRNVPVEISVLFTGYCQGELVYHLLPPRPPLTLDAMYTCSSEDLCRFVDAGRFGYFRHVLRARDLPVSELLAAHVQQAGREQALAGNPGWIGQATRELITLLRDDYPTLMSVLGALADIQPDLYGAL
jgi:hypothetical protein